MSEQVPEGWVEKSLGEISTIMMGQLPDSNTHNNEGNGLPFFQGKADFGVRSPKVKSWCAVPSKIAPEDSILFSIRAPVGDINQFEKECCIGRGLVAITAEDVDHDFLYHILLQSKSKFEALGQGSTFEIINGGELREFSLSIPPLPEQKKIAAILTSVDKVIENTTRQIDKLQGLKKATMNELLTKGTDHTEFKDSELGRIPKSWEVLSISQSEVKLLDGDRGKNYPKEQDFKSEGHCLFLSAKNVTKDGFKFDEQSYISKEKHEQMRNGTLKRGDIVITTRGTVGNLAYFHETINQDVIRINSGMAIIQNSDKKFDTKFLYVVLGSELIEQQKRLLTYGSAQLQLKISTLGELKVPTPSIIEQLDILKIVESLTSSIRMKRKKLNQIQSLKKALMQDLLTGKVRVRQNSA